MISRAMSFSALSISPRLFWGLTGLTLIGCHAALAWISPEFGYDLPLLEQPVVTMVFIELAAGAVFLLAVWGAVSRRWTKDRAFPWIICVGIFLRGVMFVSTPMLEHDYYRYLWDGAVLADGAPRIRTSSSPKQAVERFGTCSWSAGRLVHQSGAVIARVSFRELRTIYPPVAQAAFAAACTCCAHGVNSH